MKIRYISIRVELNYLTTAIEYLMLLESLLTSVFWPNTFSFHNKLKLIQWSNKLWHARILQIFFARKPDKIAIEPIKITILLNATLCNMLTYVSMSPFCLGRELHFCKKDLPCLEIMMSLPIYHR